MGSQGTPWPVPWAFVDVPTRPRFAALLAGRWRPCRSTRRRSSPPTTTALDIAASSGRLDGLAGAAAPAGSRLHGAVPGRGLRRRRRRLPPPRQLVPRPGARPASGIPDPPVGAHHRGRAAASGCPGGRRAMPGTSSLRDRRPDGVRRPVRRRAADRPGRVRGALPAAAGRQPFGRRSSTRSRAGRSWPACSPTWVATYRRRDQARSLGGRHLRAVVGERRRVAGRAGWSARRLASWPPTSGLGRAGRRPAACAGAARRPERRPLGSGTCRLDQRRQGSPP